MTRKRRIAPAGAGSGRRKTEPGAARREHRGHSGSRFLSDELTHRKQSGAAEDVWAERWAAARATTEQ